MPLNINMHILYIFFYSWYSFWYVYMQSNEWKTDQPNKEVTDRQKTTVVDFVTAERTNAGVQMFVCMSMHAYLKALPHDPFKKPNHIMAPHRRRETLHPDVKIIPHHAR